MGLDSRQIILSEIEIKNGDTLVYHYETGSYMRRFLTGSPLWVQYEGSVKDIPPAISAIPFLGVVSQIIWFYHGILDIPVLDSKYAESMDTVKAAYQAVYKTIPLKGKVDVGEKVSLKNPDYPRKAVFFTGGIDSMATALRHKHENPLLISIWGSEQRTHETEAWHRVSETQINHAAQMGLNRSVITSNYLDILQQWALKIYFPGRLLRSWYVEVAYGPLFLGLSAPLAWREGIGKIYIASSYTAESQSPDGSRPTLIENTEWAGTKAVYDGFHEERQTKLGKIIHEFNGNFTGLELNVCADGVVGVNCSLCEKCSITMAGLALLGVDPSRHGFNTLENTPERITRALRNNEWRQPPAWQLSYTKFWHELQQRIFSCRDIILPEWREFFDWLSKSDIESFFPQRSKHRLEEAKRTFMKLLPFRLYRDLRLLKIRMSAGINALSKETDE